jgi:hypothetical protein
VVHFAVYKPPNINVSWPQRSSRAASKIAVSYQTVQMLAIYY